MINETKPTVETIELDGDEVTGPRILVVKVCVWCGGESHLTMLAEKFDRWHNGRELVQRVWPEATAGQRETLISGSHEACFDAVFAEEE